MNVLRLGRWSPYAVGIGIGVLSWITFAFMGKALGTSTTMVSAAGAIEGIVATEHVEQNAYFAKYLLGTPEKPASIVDWQFALVIMMFFGALLAARLSRSTFRQYVPKLWEWRFGPSRMLRYAGAFVGGAILIFGARMAGGCTSGHSISGGLQLAVSSWVFTGALFATGITTAFILFGTKGRAHV